MTNYTHPMVPLVLAAVVITATLATTDDTAVAAPGPSDWTTTAPHTPLRTAALTDPSITVDDVVDQYCVRCHSDRRLTGNLTLEEFTLEGAAERGETAEKMIRKLRAGMMPPPGARRPEGDTLDALVMALESRMDEIAKAAPNPGRRSFQRLNRAEYHAAVKDLLGVNVDVSAFLPLDTKSANFDNIADAQLPSATLMEGYLRAAFQVAKDALGDPNADPSSTPYRVPRTMSQKERVAGAPFGTRGGISVMHNFPADGNYIFRVMLHAAPEGELYGRDMENERVEVSIDGERVAVLDIDRWMSDSDPMGMTLLTDSIHVSAGARRVTAAFIKQFEGPVDDLITPQDHTLADTQIGLDYGITTMPHLQLFTVVGPYNATGVSDTPTRKAIFTCRPTTAAEARPCAQSIVERLGTKAYRRPLASNDIEGLMAFYDQGESDGGFEAGVRLAVQAIVASPHFVFRTEALPSDIDGRTYSIADSDLASRLSFFLWGTVPDQELIDLAAQKRLSDQSVLRQQIERMLADERSSALSTRFAAQWLRLGDLEKVHPDALDYPFFDYTLAQAMEQETELLFDYLVREDRPVTELLTADYTFVNERLARHYGIDDVVGDDFQMVQYPNDTRRGILGHGSILTQTSHANRTSPVLRGKWIMEVVLGTPPPPPPPDVPDLEATAGVEDGRVLTVRERMEQHRANPTCNSCHRFIDPLGLALENFDVTGAWRTKDEGNPVDPVGEMYDGTELTSPADLRNALMKRPEVFLRNFTENLMAYALGRRVEWYDQPTVRAITADARQHDYSMSSFIMGVATSQAFRGALSPVAAEQVEASQDASLGGVLHQN